MSKDNKEETKKVDEELSELLDSALEDFSQQPKEEKVEEIVNRDNSNDVAVNDELMRQAAAVFQSHFDGGGAGVELNEQQIEDAKQRMQEMMESPEFRDFTATITDTIQGLNQGAEGLQNPLNEDNFLNIFDQNAPLMPFMQGMMQNLLSKDVLYPSIKEISGKFPVWLEDNKDTISVEDKSRYEKQHVLMVEVCQELETEESGDSEEVKKERFEKVLSLMQKMQEYGEPPAELVAGGETGMLPTPPQDCLIM